MNIAAWACLHRITVAVGIQSDEALPQYPQRASPLKRNRLAVRRGLDWVGARNLSLDCTWSNTSRLMIAGRAFSTDGDLAPACSACPIQTCRHRPRCTISHEPRSCSSPCLKCHSEAAAGAEESETWGCWEQIPCRPPEVDS
jgi:hypothetical protein